MVSKQFLSAFCFLFFTSEAIRCRYQTPSFELSRSGETIIDYGGIGFNNLFSCSLGSWFSSVDYGCHSTQWEGTYTLTRNGETLSDYSFTTETQGCMTQAVCESLAGGTDQCEYATYSWDRWLPTSCDASSDYDAWTEARDVTLSLSCCTDDDHCNEDEDYSGCVENSAFSNYLDDLNTCWTKFKKDFMTELLCDNEDDDIFEWAYNCTNSDGTWKSDENNNPVCRYRATCTEGLQNMLASFGECACRAASDSDYSGDFIATAMEAAWESWCPGIQLSCSDDIVSIFYTYYVVTYSFVLDTSDALTDAIKYKIINAVAEYLNVHNGSITITQDDDSSTRRRLQETSVSVEIKVSTEDDADEIEDRIDSGLDGDVESSSGYTVSDSDSSKEERNSTSTGNYNNGSANRQVNVSNFVLLVTFLAIFATFVQ